MRIPVVTVVLVACTVLVTAAEEPKSTKDSYLAALRNSHQINGLIKGPVRIARGDYDVVPSSSYDYNVAPSYDAAPGHQTYGPPKPIYGPPKPVYGPPPHPAPMTHGTPYFSPEKWLLSKIKLKFDFFTIAKILLKLVIFKKIVKFIALLCLLFFIPTLKPSDDGHSGEESGEEYRRRSYDIRYDYEQRLNDVTQFALTAMEAFTVDNALYCPEENILSCRFKRMFDVVDESYPVKRILRIAVPSDSGSSEDASQEITEPENGIEDASGESK